MRHPWLAALLFAACGGSSPKATPMAGPADPSAGPTCAQVSDHLMAMISPTAKDAPTDEIDQMRIKVTRQCEDTAWSLAARRCVMDATAATETTACDSMFTDRQRNAWPAEPTDRPADERTGGEGRDQALEGAAAPAATAPPPAPPPKAVQPAETPKNKAKPSRSNGKAPGADSDPCDGGE
jgi:hypothetical protein